VSRARRASRSSRRPDLSSDRPPEAQAFEREFPGSTWLASRVARELTIVGGIVEAAVSGEARQFGLSHAALNALAVIEGAGEPMLTGEVAARMHVTSGSVTSVLDNLEKKGFVVRSNDPADRRRVLVDLTPEAQAVLDELLPRIARNNDFFTAGLEEAQLQAVLDALAVVQAGLAALPSEPPEAKPRRRPARLTRLPADS